MWRCRAGGVLQQKGFYCIVPNYIPQRIIWGTVATQFERQDHTHDKIARQHAVIAKDDV